MTKRINRSTLLVLLVAALNVALFAAFAGLRLVRPSDGMRLQPGEQAFKPDGVIVTSLEQAPGDLQTGDLVVAIEGRRLEAWAAALLCWRPVCASPDRPIHVNGDRVKYSIVRDGQPLDVSVTLGPYPWAENLRQDWGAFAYALAMFFTGAFVFARRSDDVAARALFVGGSAILGASTWSLGLQALDFVDLLLFWLHRLTTGGSFLLYWACVFHFALAFPNPHPLVRRHRWLVPMLYAVPFVVWAATSWWTSLTAGGALDTLAQQGTYQSLTVTVYLVLSLVALVTNYRNEPSSISRQQIRVVIYAIVVNAVLAILLWQIPQLLLGEIWLTSNTIAVIGLILPLALAVSILRYRLWDIDVFINRTAVYGVLSILIVGLYSGSVSLLGTLFEQRGSVLLPLFATAVIALIFEPLRGRLQQAVNRMMYGERDTPYQVISRLGRMLEIGAAPEDLLDVITRTITEALKLPFAGIASLENGAVRMQSEYGRRPADPFVLPLVYQREVVGQLSVAQRGPHDPLNESDIRLLEDVAHQAGAVLHTVQLNHDLQLSRERLVIRVEEERRRLRRDLHDGLGPTLASYTLKLDAVLDCLDTDPATAKRLIEALKDQTKETVADIRRLVYQLRPPALDELGLVDALRAHLESSNHARGVPTVTLVAPSEGLPPLPAAVEVAAYRIIMEGVANVLHHAGATSCVVQIQVEWGLRPTLSIEIHDDGAGFKETHRTGVGLVSIRERALELGGTCAIENASTGGVQVRVALPFGERKA